MKKPDVSVIIPVLHEEAVINMVIRHVQKVSSGCTVEIIVVDGDGAGSTLAAINGASVMGMTAPAGRARNSTHVVA